MVQQIVLQVLPLTALFAETGKKVFHQIKKQTSGSEKMENFEREIYDNMLRQQVSKQLDTLSLKCHMVFNFCKYFSQVFKLLLAKQFLQNEESLPQYEQHLKEAFHKILLEENFLQLLENIIIFSKYYQHSIQEGILFNEKQGKFFTFYSYLTKIYQTLFFLYKFFNTNYFESLQLNEEDNCSPTINEKSPLLQKVDSQNLHLQKTQSIENEEIGSFLCEQTLQNIHKSFKEIFNYFFLNLQNAVFFCVLKYSNEFAHLISLPLKNISTKYSLNLKKQIIVSQTKHRVKKNMPNNFSQSQTLKINRENIIQESIPALFNLKIENLCLNTLYIKWKNELGVDEGGPRREWFSLIFSKIFNPDYGLFVQNNKNYTYMPNPFSFFVPNHLVIFKFIGILLGKAFIENYAVQANFAIPFVKLFLKKKINFQDLEEIDPKYYESLNWMLKNQIDDIFEHSFIYSKQFAGQTIEIELQKDGKNIIVRDKNKVEYIKSVTHAKLIREIYYQSQALITGFQEIVSSDFLSILDEQMLQFIFSGSPEISIQELKENISLDGYTKNDKQIIWLFEILETFNNYEKSCFIFFITGSMNLPHGGFKQFPITINQTLRTDRLPVAHTCGNSIDLPNYATKERLEDALRKALFECAGFELA